MDFIPEELICKIYEFDPTKRFQQDKVCHQMHMRQIFYELFSTDKVGIQCPYEEWIFRFGSDNPLYHITEEMYEERVRFQRRWQRIHGSKSRLPFDEFDLASQLFIRSAKVWSQS